MNPIFRSIRRRTKLYKKPDTIGDTFNLHNETWLVIGIQGISIEYSTLDILYVCQRISEDAIIPPPLVGVGEPLVPFTLRIETGKEHILENVRLGRLFYDQQKRPYQSVEYGNVDIVYTDVMITVYARPIRAVSRHEARSKYRNQQKKTLKLLSQP
ncbi:hypothetical protein MKX54_20075 [Alkalihalobacillus sp. FSL R5-0424]